MGSSSWRRDGDWERAGEKKKRSLGSCWAVEWDGVPTSCITCVWKRSPVGKKSCTALQKPLLSSCTLDALALVPAEMAFVSLGWTAAPSALTHMPQVGTAPSTCSRYCNTPGAAALTQPEQPELRLGQAERKPLPRQHCTAPRSDRPTSSRCRGAAPPTLGCEHKQPSPPHCHASRNWGNISVATNERSIFI